MSNAEPVYVCKAIREGSGLVKISNKTVCWVAGDGLEKKGIFSVQ